MNFLKNGRVYNVTAKREREHGNIVQQLLTTRKLGEMRDQAYAQLYSHFYDHIEVSNTCTRARDTLTFARVCVWRRARHVTHTIKPPDPNMHTNTEVLNG